MPERSNGKKNTTGTTLDLLGDEEPMKPRAARKPAPTLAPLTAPDTEPAGALFGGEDVDLTARHPADVPVGSFPAPSQIAQAAESDPFGEEDPFEDSVMARMLADEPAPIASPLRAAREDFQAPAEAAPMSEPEPVAEPELAEPELAEPELAEPELAEPELAEPELAEPELLAEPEPVGEIEAEPMTEAGPDLDAFADPVAAPEVEQEIEPPLAEALPEAAAEALLEPELLAAPEPPPAPAKKAKAAPVDTPAPGLTFERRYTEAGQDVWATTDWELRTASIVGSDGKVVFEQSGVEIPKAWSQLATNVVVSKYFRGQIGTLEREYSVKQLIGRVADRIVEWGREGSYFASDADAEVFHDELRYILLHQYAAFNSPVWFNLGWAGRRQAVSACLPYDVRVNTDRGLLPIGEIVRLFGANPQAQIFTFAPDGSPSRIVAAVCNGRKRVFRYHLADGSTLRCTSNHRVFVRGYKGEIVEKEAGNLVAGVDRLILSRSVLLPKTTVQDLHSLTPDTDLAWLTGLMVGDGYCGRSQSLTSDTWDLKINTVPEKDRAEAVLTKYGVPFRTHIKSWGFCLRGHGAVSRAFWSALGLWGRVGDKQVPEWIYRTSAKNIGAFLGGLFDADGHVSQNENRRLPVFSNTSLPLVQAAQTLLRSLGIYAALTAYTDSRDDYARKTSYSLGIHDNLSVEQFEVHVGFTHAEKQARMTERQLAIASSLRASDVLLVSKTQGGSEYVYDIQTESETFWAEGILLHNCYITEVNDTMESILDLYKTEGMLFKDGSGSGQNLSSLRSSKEPLAAGGRSSGPIAFMKGLDASAGSIKSGGSTRRAAKMVILDADHPDIQEFVDCKKDAELKAHALIDAGYSGAFNVANGAYDTVPFQNANHSVRVTDQFMQAAEADGPWDTKFRTTGETAETLRAKDLLHSIAEGTWTCGDPGMQFDTISNDWHTCANTDRIYASNPCCFVGETLIETAEGQIPFASLYARHEAGEDLPTVFSFDRHNRQPALQAINKVWIAGHTRELVEVKTERGLTFRCTPEHRFLTQGGEFVEARHLAVGTALCSLRCAAKDLPENSEALVATLAEAADVLLSVTPLTLEDDVAVYDMEVEGTHNFAITDGHSAGLLSIVVSNSEFFFLNSTACNLSSLNLMKFREAGSGAFDTASFEHAVKIMITAQEMMVGFAHYPTEKITSRSHEYRPLGLGYANLGALLMAAGLPYDSDAGRAYAGAVTSLMTGRAYHQSAQVARDCGGPFAGYAHNREPMLRVMGKHRAAVDDIDAALIPETLLQAARTAWDETVALGELHGYRNAQATVLAPTGCLVAGSLVITDRGVVRLNRLGDVHGSQWQDVNFGVLTDTGQQQATKFYVNGRDATRRITTRTGYAIQGTPKHRIKVVDAATGHWDWKRFGDIAPGDVVALSMGQMLGEPQAVTLPPLGEEYWTGDYTTRVPRTMTADLAELIGYFMGDGSMHAKGPRFCVANTDLDVAERVQFLVKSLFNLDAHLTPQQGYCEVAVHSVPLTLWWEACGFAKLSPGPEHSGKGYLPRIPDAVLATNDPAVYGAFLRGLYEADGTVTGGVPCWSTVHRPFSEEVKTLLLALGIPTSTKQDTTGWGQSPLWVLRLRNTSYTARYREAVGFMSARKAGLVSKSQSEQAARHDYIYLAPEVIAELVPKNSPLYNAITLSQKRHPGAITRRSAEALYAATQEARVGHALRFFYDVIASNEDGGEQLTYDLSVPANVTYIAQGFVSHNTIGFLMDCDTTGIEPDIAIVKYKSLVGGGMMKIVNQTVPEALERLGYSEAERQSIIGFIDEHDTIEGATDLKPEHLPIFDCAFRPMNGTRSIHYRGHIKMMAAAQPFISGAISKCVTGDTLLATGRGLVRIGSLYQNEKPDTFRPARLPLASLGGTRETDAFYYGGGKPTLGVTLRSGHRITGTPNHRLLVARAGRLDWVRLDEIESGEAVATQYGTDLWAETPPRLPVLTTPLHGSEKRVALPETMTEELAWLLGAYAAEGHTTRSNWTVTLTNSVDAVLERAVSAWQSEFGVKAVIERQPGKCPGVKVSSKRIVLWMEALGCGARASAKRIPDAILQSPRPMVLSFLSGLMLDGYAVPEGTLARVALCLDAPLLLDDLQAILTNLGLVHSRISKKNNTNGKTYDEVYLAGEWAQQFARLVPFMEPDKAASAARLLTRTFAQSTADVVPGLTGRALQALIPAGRARAEFYFLADPRTKQVSRRTLERVAARPGVVLPEWLQSVLRDNLRFSPVTEVNEAGVQTVYDVSVPVTHAFVGNGIVNHNTVNLPNSATPDDIAETYMEAWKLGIKAVAVYRDGSKRTQPLNMGKETPAADKAAVQTDEVETSSATLIPAVPKAVRRRLPNERDGVTHKFSIGGHEGYLTVGLYPDTRQPGEIFIRMSKEGSSISGLMDSFATAISLALQYGVPLQTLVDKFIHSRFEPSGFTGNKEIPMAKSVMDYIFRYLALRFLQAEDRHNVGLLADQPADDAYPAHDARSGTLSNGSNGSGIKNGNGTGDLSHLADTRTATLSEHEREIYRAQSDAPPCPECGAITIRNGACYRCVSCGTSLGCS